MWLCSSSTSIIEGPDSSAHLDILTIRAVCQRSGNGAWPERLVLHVTRRYMAADRAQRNSCVQQQISWTIFGLNLLSGRQESAASVLEQGRARLASCCCARLPRIFAATAALEDVTSSPRV